MQCPINQNNNKFRAIFCDIKQSLCRLKKEPLLYLLFGTVLLLQNIHGLIYTLLSWVFFTFVFYAVKHYFFVKPPVPEAVAETEDASLEEVLTAQELPSDDSKPTGA